MAACWEPTVLSELVSHLANGSLHLFAGAGLSVLAGFPRWEDLLKKFASAYERIPNFQQKFSEELPEMVSSQRIDIVDFLIDCGFEGKKQYAQILRETFFAQKRFHSVHERLLGLPFSGFITTNYDRCFEDCASQRDIKPYLANSRWFCYPPHQHVENPNPFQNIDGSEPYLLHMHGCIEANGKVEAENIILSEKQYHEFYEKPEMKGLWTKCFYHNILFLGTSMKDPFFQIVFNKVRSSSSSTNIANRKRCYFVFPESEKRGCPAIDEQRYDVIYSYFADWDKGLEDMIGELDWFYRSNQNSVIAKPEIGLDNE